MPWEITFNFHTETMKSDQKGTWTPCKYKSRHRRVHSYCFKRTILHLAHPLIIAKYNLDQDLSTIIYIIFTDLRLQKFKKLCVIIPILYLVKCPKTWHFWNTSFKLLPDQNLIAVNQHISLMEAPPKVDEWCKTVCFSSCCAIL